MAADIIGSLNVNRFQVSLDTRTGGYNYTSFSIVARAEHEDLTYPNIKTAFTSAGFITLNDQTTGQFSNKVESECRKLHIFILLILLQNNLVRRFLDREVPNSAPKQCRCHSNGSYHKYANTCTRTAAEHKPYDMVWDLATQPHINPSGSTWGSVNATDGALTELRAAYFSYRHR